MIKDIICIVCPNGCRMTAEESGDGITVTGNTCKNGEKFAIEELTHPVRTISSTVKTRVPGIPVEPVRVSGPIPKGMIFPVMKEINKVCLEGRVSAGDVVIADVLGLGVDVIAIQDM